MTWKHPWTPTRFHNTTRLSIGRARRRIGADEARHDGWYAEWMSG